MAPLTTTASSFDHRRRRRGWRRSLLGFFLAPLVPGALLAPLVTERFLLPSRPLAEKALSLLLAVPIGAICSGFVGYPAALLVFLPLHIAMRASGRRTISVYAAIGAVAGALAWPIPGLIWTLSRVSPPADSFLSAVGLVPLFAASGAVAGGAYWALVRPDRTGTPTGASARNRR